MPAETLGVIALGTEAALGAARVRMQALLRLCGLPPVQVDFLSVGFHAWCQDMQALGVRELGLSFWNHTAGSELWVDAQQNPQQTTSRPQEPYAGSAFFKHVEAGDGLLRVLILVSEGAADPHLLTQLRTQMNYKTRDQLIDELQRHKQHLEEEVAAQTAALRSSAAQIRATLEGSPVAVRVAAVSDGRLLFVNTSFAALYGVDRAMLLAEGMRSMEVQSNESADILEALRQGKDVLNCPVALARPMGEPIHVVASYLNVTYDDTPAVLTWMFDVTDLRRAKELAEEASRVRSDFLSNMSHEIRTPLNAIIGMSHLTLETTLSSQQQAYVTKIYKAGKSLLGIVTDILDYSKIENGQITLEAKPFQLDSVLADIHMEHAGKALEKGLTYRQTVQSGVPLDLVGDEHRLRQVLNHLVGNAIKFTAHGEVNVVLSCPQCADGRAQLQCSVSDTGVGMSSEQRSKLFQAFSQGDSSSTRQFGGTGLGLVICHQMLVLMDGGIWVESEIAKGSVFVFDAWFGAADAPRLQADPAPVDAASSTASDQTPATHIPSPPWAAPRQALARMRILLDDSDAEAVDLLADIESASAPPQVQAQLRALERQVNEFNFKDALCALDEIERLMG